MSDLCVHENFTTEQNGMWNSDTCHDCGANGPRYDIEYGLNDDAGRLGYFSEDYDTFELDRDVEAAIESIRSVS